MPKTRDAIKSVHDWKLVYLDQMADFFEFWETLHVSWYSLCLYVCILLLGVDTIARFALNDLEVM